MPVNHFRGLPQVQFIYLEENFHSELYKKSRFFDDYSLEKRNIKIKIRCSFSLQIK